MAQVNELDHMVSCGIISKIQEGEQTAFLGPVVFLVMVNDLAYRLSYRKYVDVILVSEVNSHAWSAINYTRFGQHYSLGGRKLYEPKTEEVQGNVHLLPC